MEAAIECTHCGVTMTGWSAPGSPIRYWQCPFCARTYSSLYAEVFRRGAGARVVDAPVRAADPARLPMPSAQDIRWADLKQRAARWFARLEAEGRPCERAARPAPDDLDVEIEIDLEPAPVAMPAAARRR
jgi:tRNA(Ile2) C34 agmatinyltransferase TiaS